MEINFLQYLAGLIDSDGNIDLSFRKRIKGHAPFLKITIAQKNYLFLKKIQEQLLTEHLKCYLYATKQTNCYILELNGKTAELLNYRISKYLQLKKHRSLFVSKYSYKNRFPLSKSIAIRRQFLKLLEIQKFNKKISIPWFAGFIDGDGCFLVENSKLCSKLRCRLSITYHRKYDYFFFYIKKIYGGHTRIVKNHYQWKNSHQWTMDLTLKNYDNFLIPLIEFLYLKKYQALLISYYLENRHLKFTQKEKIEIKDLVSRDKYERFCISMYQQLAKFTAIYPNVGKNVYYPALGLCGEVGELAEKVIKIIKDKGKITNSQKIEIGKEIADVTWYIAAVCSELGISMETAMKENIKKLQSRKKRNKLHGKGDNR